MIETIETPFLDANLLVYTCDPRDPLKKDHAKRVIDKLVAEGKPIVSVQVLSEFFRAVTRGRIPLMLAQDAEARVHLYISLFDVRPNTVEVLSHALAVRRLRRISFWDALVHAAAKLAGAKLVLSEDLVHLDTFEGVRYLNPFASLSPAPPA